MRRPQRPALLLTGTAVTAVLLLGGCSDQLGDRGGQEGAPPDKISDVGYVEIFRNIDNFPNIARICVDGLGFASTSSADGYSDPSLIRVPEWDAVCAQHAGRTTITPSTSVTVSASASASATP